MPNANSIFLFGLLVACLIRIPYALMYSRRAEQRALRNGLDSLILVFVIFGMFIAPVLYLCTDALAFADFDASFPGRLPLGTIVFALGLWLLWRSHSDLGANWSPTIEKREQHTLITEGVYKRVRHPMYTAHFFWGLAQAILLENWVAGPSLLISFLLLYANRVAQEEELMLSLFGQEYEQYMSRTGRLFPQFLG